MKTKIFDMAYEIDGDTADVEQDVGCGEVNAVYLHKIHIALLASEMGLLKGDGDAWRRVDMLERRIQILRDRIEHLDDMLWSVPCMPPGSGPTGDCVYSDATLEIADQFCADLGNAPKKGSVDGSNTTENGTVAGANPPKLGGSARGTQADLLKEQQ